MYKLLEAKAEYDENEIKYVDDFATPPCIYCQESFGYDFVDQFGFNTCIKCLRRVETKTLLKIDRIWRSNPR